MQIPLTLKKRNWDLDPDRIKNRNWKFFANPTRLICNTYKSNSNINITTACLSYLHYLENNPEHWREITCFTKSFKSWLKLN